MQSRGPTWLGIGAMRSGTTFLADLLTQHPQVGLGHNGRKEQRFLHWDSHSSIASEKYLREFDDEGIMRGEFSPRYLWMARTASNAERFLAEGAPIITVLRDPVARYESHMRLAAHRRSTHPAPIWRRDIASGLALLNGFYDDLLVPWARVFGPDRIILATFEDLISAPAEVCGRIWRRMGLTTHMPLQVPAAKTNASPPAETHSVLSSDHEQLISIYSPHVERLRNDWGLDTSRWNSFPHLD